jgi:hypothetical protein
VVKLLNVITRSNLADMAWVGGAYLPCGGGGGELSALVVAFRRGRLRGRSTAYPQRCRRGKAGHLVHRVVASERGNGLALFPDPAVRVGAG